MSRFAFAVVWAGLGLAGLAQFAQAECLSASAITGATTTVFQCPDQTAARGEKSLAVTQPNTTVVERGSSDLPWFPSKSGKRQTAPEALVEKADTTQLPKEVKKVEIEKKPEISTAKKKLVSEKAATKKPVKKKLVKRKSVKTKVAKTAPKQPEDGVITWTREDLSLGQRIGNWLGF